VALDFSRPGRPGDNALIEAFNGRLRQECLSQHWFLSLVDVQATLAAWRDEQQTPAQFRARANHQPGPDQLVELRA
jgi:putative transposase